MHINQSINQSELLFPNDLAKRNIISLVVIDFLKPGTPTSGPLEIERKRISIPIWGKRITVNSLRESRGLWERNAMTRFAYCTVFAKNRDSAPSNEQHEREANAIEMRVTRCAVYQSYCLKQMVDGTERRSGRDDVSRLVHTYVEK